jgi:malate synthase
VPSLTSTPWTEAKKQQELDNNIPGIVGYRVRLVDQSIECSKVPDIPDIGLMEVRLCAKGA